MLVPTHPDAAGPSRPRLLVEGCIAFLVASVFYFGLTGELPYHDADRFTNQVASGVWVWDIAHILLQPAAILLQQATGAMPVAVLKAVSILCSAAAVGLFWVLLRTETPWYGALFGTMLLAGSCSVLTLAPSAHPKLMAFPFVNGALLCLHSAERGGMRNRGLIAGGGLLLAAAGAFLVSAMATAPFAALAVLGAARRGGMSWRQALGQGVVFGLACGTLFVLVVCVGFIVFTGEPLSLTGLIGSVSGKADLRPSAPPLLVYMARAAFGTVNNLVALPELGATIQAWLRGQFPSLRPYAGLLPLLALCAATGLVIAATMVRAGATVARGGRGLVALAFLCGAQAWSIYYGLNDPEHWFQLTAPTILLFVITMPPAIVAWGLPAYAGLVVATNLTLLSIPVTTYPVARHEAEFAAMLKPQDLLVMFVAYPGRPSAAVFKLPGRRKLVLDVPMTESGARPRDTLEAADAEIKATLAAGGRVLVADVLRPDDWEAPWMSLLGKGVTKQDVWAALMHSRVAERLPDIGGIALWELRPAARP